MAFAIELIKTLAPSPGWFTDPQTGQSYPQPSMLDVTAEVVAAAQAQGVTLDPARVRAVYHGRVADFDAVELMPMQGTCPPGSPQQGQPYSANGRHYGWTAFGGSQRAGFSFMPSVCGMGADRWLMCNMESTSVPVRVLVWQL